MFKRILTAVIGLALVATATFASDWRTCDTELIIGNNLSSKMIYQVFWLDHGIKEYQGRPAVRCGGEIDKFTFSEMGEDFRLCPGRHIVLWYVMHSVGRVDKYNAYMVTITPGQKQVMFTPDGPKVRKE